MKLARYILIVTFVSLVLLSAALLLYRKGKSNFYSLENPVKEMLYGKENYDVLFIGSSRTKAHVNPRIVDSVTGLNTFNAGLFGSNIIEMNLMLQCYLQKHIPPKLVVADFSVNAFDVGPSPISAVQYYEYIDNPMVYKLVSKYHKRAYLWKAFPIMELCETNEMEKVQALLGLFGKKERTVPYKGYKGYDETLTNRPTYDDPYNFAIDRNSLNIFSNIIYTCKQNNIQLLCTYSPEFYLVHHKTGSNFFKTVTGICEKNNIPFLNYRDEEICKQKEYFADPVHLNNKGATQFSLKLANEIKSRVEINNKKMFPSIYYTQNSF